MRFAFFSALITILFSALFIVSSNDVISPERGGPWLFPCVSYAPTAYSNDVEEQKGVISEDLQQLTSITSCVRIYSYMYPYYLVPPIAESLGLETIAGVWIEKGYEDDTDEQIERVIKDVRSGRDFKYVIVGNETTLHQRATQDELLRYIKRMKEGVDVPISTAEPSRIWLNDKVDSRIIEEVDFISTNMLSFWYEIPGGEAISLINSEYLSLKEKFEKRIFLSEIGWPTAGPTAGKAIASVAAQHRMFNALPQDLLPEIDFYNVIEAYDIPWKMFTVEGLTGAHWGIFTNSREKKQSGVTPSSIFWNNGAIVYIFVNTGIWLLFFFFIYKKYTVRISVLLPVFFIVQALICADAYIFWKLFELYIIYNTLQTSVILALTGLATIMVFWECYEMLQIERLRGFSHIPQKGYKRPFISIHIPTKNESPEVVIRTIQSCLELRYSNFEIIVVSNNCRDEAIWKPVEVFCRTFEKIRFYHEEKLPGYKAGALNFALEKTSRDAQWVAVVDADYIVQKEWLERAAPFMDENISVVQMPQHYRSENNTRLEELLIAENNTVFKGGGMVFRDFYNTAIQHGTMCLVQKKDLLEVGGWSKNSVTEDAELGFRLVASGKRIISLPIVCGSGLAPQSIQALLNQRFRWAYGAARVCIEHWNVLFGTKGSLTLLQRANFLFGWLPWFAQALYPFLLVFLMVKTWALLGEPKDVIPGSFFLIIVLLVATYIVKFVYTASNAGVRAPLKISQLIFVQSALTPTVAAASVLALFKKRIPFKSTHSSHDGTQGAMLDFLKNLSRLSIIGFGVLASLAMFRKYSFTDGDIIMYNIFTWSLILPTTLFYLLYYLQSKKND